MTIPNSIVNRRSEPRQISDDVLRWKRPGRIEDQRGWSLDLSSCGMGFMTGRDAAPSVGESLHLRRLNGDVWETIERPVRVARVSDTTSPEIVVVGCRMEAPETPKPAEGTSSS